MKLTTLRVSRDLWELLEKEAERVGTSVSQYMREAALARAAAAAAARGESPFDRLAGGQLEQQRHGAGSARVQSETPVIARARDAKEGAKALRAQSRQVHAHTRDAKEGAHALRAQSHQAQAQTSKRTERAKPVSRRRAD